MKRVLLLGGVVAAGLVAVPAASAYDPFDGQRPVVVDADSSDGSVGVGTWYGPRQPLVGARYNTGTGEACVGFSYQIPFCASLAS